MGEDLGVSLGWLETILRKDEYDKSIAKITGANISKPKGGKGENYASMMVPAKLDVVHGSGRCSTLALLIKIEILKTDTFKAIEIFITEIDAYQFVLKLMECEMAESGDDSGIFWPVYYGCRPYDLLVLQDLSMNGYKNVNRANLLDFKHTEMALNHLAKFHALSIALVEKGKINWRSMKKSVYHQDLDLTRDMFGQGFSQFLRCSKEWGSEWESARIKIEELRHTLHSRIVKLGEVNPSELNVINHGDFWINNFLFKTDPMSGNPISMKFVDFQLIHYNSFAWDFVYFIYSSVKRELHREVNLLELYHRFLVASLKDLGVDASNTTLQNLRNEIKRIEVFSLAISIIILPIVIANPDNPADIAAIGEGGQIYSSAMYTDPNYVNIVKQDIKFFMENGII